MLSGWKTNTRKGQGMKKDANRIGVWGGSGSGKSTCLSELLVSEPRQIVLDPLDDWKMKRNYKTVHSLNQLYKTLKRDWNKDFKIVFNVDTQKLNPVETLHQLSGDLFVIQKPYNVQKDKRKIALVVDEMADFFPNRPAMLEHDFYHLSRKGRHYGINIYGASQRLAEVHTSFRGNARENYFFRQDQAIDVQRALQSIGSEWKSELLSLKDHEYLHKVQGKVTKGKNKCNFK